jgi:amino acid adenylation domain-containing protein
MGTDEYSNSSLPQKKGLIPPRVTGTLQSETLVGGRAPKKTRLKQLQLRETTSAILQVIKKARAEQLPDYFEQTCDRRQHETAIIYGASRLTYQELDRRANQLAHLLIERGITKGDLVGILLERSLDSYIALLGVLKAGAAFVPLDLSFSSDQVAFIAEDAGLRDFITTSSLYEKTNTLICPFFELDQSRAALSMQRETRPQVRVDPESICSIIYMLGDTDRSQGVAFSHTNIVNFLRVATPIYGVKRSDRVYQGMSPASDFSIEEIWPSWIVGATLVADPSNAQRVGSQLIEFLNEHKITVMRCTLKQLATIESDVPSLNTLLVSGTTPSTELIERWSRPGRRILATYGPIETTVTATWCELTPNCPITIGTPFPTYHIYILDDQLQLVKEGKSGEICIGGPSVAIGYHNNPHLTQERFILNPVLRNRESVPRLYRTGDLGRITSSGEIEYFMPHNRF